MSTCWWPLKRGGECGRPVDEGLCPYHQRVQDSRVARRIAGCQPKPRPTPVVIEPDDVTHFASWARNLEDLARMLNVSLARLRVVIDRHAIQLPRHVIVGQEDLIQWRFENRGNKAAS